MDFLWVMSLLIFSLPEIYYFSSKPIFSGPISINTSEKANRWFARYTALLNVCVILLNTICRTLFVHTNIRRDRQTHAQITDTQINTHTYTGANETAHTCKYTHPSCASHWHAGHLVRSRLMKQTGVWKKSANVHIKSQQVSQPPNATAMPFWLSVIEKCICMR